MSMDKRHLIPLLTTEEFRQFPDQTTEILNRLITEVNDRRNEIVELTNAIIVLQNQVKKLSPSPTPPTPQGDFQQVLNFYPEDMGNTPGWCLQNVMDGFHIQVWASGIDGAYQDMLWNKNNGTLHEEIYPPADIAVPIYIRTQGPYHHVVAWDHGVVYDDKVRRDNWVDYFGAQNIWGWGEYCDGIRVVQRTN